LTTANKPLAAVTQTPVGRATLAAFGLLALLSGCSSTDIRIARDFRETPEISRTNMTGAIDCMASALQTNGSDNAYVFMVREVNDGTVKDSPLQDGPLSDAGRIQLMNVLSDHLYPYVGLVTDTFPPMFTTLPKEDVGLNRFGLPAPGNLQVFLAAYSGIIQNARRAKNLPPARNIIPLVVHGSFTRFDTDNLAQEGSGQNLGTRTRRLAQDEIDDTWRKTSGEVDIGDTSSARLVSLVMNLVDPRNNLVVSSQSFDLVFYRKNKTFRLRIGVGEGYYGISKSHIAVEGIHGAQKTLLDAAAFWLLNKAYGGKTDFASCFASDAQRKLTMTPKQFSQISQTNLEAQAALAEKAGKATKGESPDKHEKTDKSEQKSTQ